MGDYRIVVVDNDSANGSFERLRRHYGDVPDVTLLHNDSNEGFARGNNVGYRYCRDRLGCEYIITINNDAMIACDDFIDLCIEDYERTGCAVIGPDILSLRDRRHQNPSYGIIDTHAEVSRQTKRFRRILMLERMHLFGPLTAIKSYLKKNASSVNHCAHADAHPIEGRPYKLHGACLIFTPIYVRRFDEAFDPGTFLYFEEHILAMRCRAAAMTMLYDDRIRVEHVEDASTDSMTRNRRAKQIFTLTHYLESLKVLDGYMR